MSEIKYAIRRERRTVFTLFGQQHQWTLTRGEIAWIASFSTWRQAYAFACILAASQAGQTLVVVPERRSP